MSSVLQQRSFIFEKLSLQTAVFIAMGVEISICVLHAIFGFTHTTLPYVLFQLVELLVCGSVLVGIKKGSHRVLLVYLIYNVIDVIYFQLIAFPMSMAASQPSWVPPSMGSYHEDTLNKMISARVAQLMIALAICENVYLLMTSLSWTIVFFAYSALKQSTRSASSFNNPLERFGSSTSATGPQINTIFKSDGLEGGLLNGDGSGGGVV